MVLEWSMEPMLHLITPINHYDARLHPKKTHRGALGLGGAHGYGGIHDPEAGEIVLSEVKDRSATDWWGSLSTHD